MSPQKKATIVASCVALILVIAKFIIGIISGSVAVLASAIDSILDFAISIFNFFAIKKSEEDPTKSFQYGKGKIQAIAAVIEGTIITLSGIFIIYKAYEKAITLEPVKMLLPSIFVMIFSIIITFLLVRYLLFIAKKTDNLVIKSDALHYQTDLWSNSAILLSLFLVWLSGYNIIDAIFGFTIGLYIIYSAIEIIIEGIKILLDHSLPQKEIEMIATIILSHPRVNSYHWLKTRSDGSSNFVEFHIVLEPDMLLLEAHRIAEQIEDEIIKIDPLKRWIITPHFDPYDDEDINDEVYNAGEHS
ncbi:MAG: cation transporter [Campylobacterales bacterium]|nr:cation transporter [Campylobacterales bacterium]